MDVEALELSVDIHIVNIYEPYEDHKPFLDSFVFTRVFDLQPIILGGEINFTTMIREVHRNTVEIHPLEEYFSHFISSYNLIDMEPISLIPTQRSSSSNDEAITKRIDWFLISDFFFSLEAKMKTWVEDGGILDHCVILLEMAKVDLESLIPFSLNHVWLIEEDYIKILEI